MKKMLKTKDFTLGVDTFIETRDDWRVTIADDPSDFNASVSGDVRTDPFFFFAAGAVVSGEVHRTPDWSGNRKRFKLHEMAAEFLEIENVDDALAFLQVYGPPYLEGEYKGEMLPIRLSTITKSVDRYKWALEHGGDLEPEHYLPQSARRSPMPPDIQSLFRAEAMHYMRSPLNLELSLDGSLEVKVICRSPEEGMRTLAFLHRMDESHLRRCSFCGKLFKPKSARTRMCPGGKCTSRATSERYRSNHPAKPRVASLKRGQKGKVAMSAQPSSLPSA